MGSRTALAGLERFDVCLEEHADVPVLGRGGLSASIILLD
jgi:hypothetical protein